MSKRIKFLYENVGNSYVEAFLTSETFADALNKVQYLIELSDYDREQMEALQKLQDGIKADQDEVEAEKGEVEALISAQNDQHAVLDGMLAVKAEALGVAQDAEANAEEQNAAIAQMLEEQKETVTATDKKDEVITTSASVEETESSTSVSDEKKDEPSQKKQTTTSVKPEKDDPPVHVHEWVTETYYTTEIETRTETETQYVTVQEVIDHPATTKDEEYYIAYDPQGNEIEEFSTWEEVDMFAQSMTAGTYMPTFQTATRSVTVPGWQETVERTVPQEVQVNRDYEVQVPHERTYCKTCGEEQN